MFQAKPLYLSKLSSKAIKSLASKDPSVAAAHGWSPCDLNDELRKRAAKKEAKNATRVPRELQQRLVAQRMTERYTTLTTVAQWKVARDLAISMVAELPADEYQRCWKSTRRAVTRLKGGGLGRWQLPYYSIPLVAFWQFCAKYGEAEADKHLLALENKAYLRRAIKRGVQDIKPRQAMGTERARERRVAVLNTATRLQDEFGVV